MNYLTSLVTKLDFMGDKISFEINKNTKFKTLLGGIFSITLYGFFIYLIYFFGEDFFNKINPTGYQITQYHKQGDEKLSLTNNTFLMGIRLEDFYLKPLDLNEYFYLSFGLNYFNNERNEEIIKHIPSITCDKVNITSEIELGIYDLSTFYCPDLSKLKNESIFGDWSTPESGRIFMYLSLCNDDQTECKDVQEINKKFDEKMILVSVVAPKIEYSITNYDKPLVVILDNYYDFLNPRKFIYEEFSFTKYLIEDDKGIVWSDTNTTTVLGVQKRKNTQDIRNIEKDPKTAVNERDRYFYFGEINYQKSYQNYNRSYTKLFDIIGNVYGAGETIIFLVILIYSYYNKMKLNSYACSRLLFLEDDNSTTDFKGAKFEQSLEEKSKYKKTINKFFNFKDMFKKKLQEDCKELYLQKDISPKNLDKDQIQKDLDIDKAIFKTINLDSDTIKPIENMNYFAKKTPEIDVLEDILEESKFNEGKNFEESNKENSFKNDFDREENSIKDSINNNNIDEENIIFQEENKKVGNQNDNIISIPENENKNKKDEILLLGENDKKENEENNEKKENDKSFFRNIISNMKKRRSQFLDPDILKPNLEFVLKKFAAVKNSMNFNFFVYLKNTLFMSRNTKLNNHYRIMFNYMDKIHNKLDIFYYMEQNKKLDLMVDIMFDPIEKKLIELVSRKYYKVKVDEDNKFDEAENGNIVFNEDTNEEMIKYIVDNRKYKNSKEEKLIKSIIH